MSASIFGDLHDFFDSTTWSVLRALVILFLLVFWIATVFWVWKDASRRIAEAPLVLAATLFGAVLPLLGPLIYMLFRPPEYLDDVRERELEIRAIERRLAARDLSCPVCGADVEHDFLVCPVCTTKLRQACESCERPLEPSWQMCPYCQTPVGIDEQPVPLRTRAPAARRSGRARRSRGS